ncbi:MAG: CBS domain-containing protein [Tenericutes bacterium]|jgi:CBS domain-containing protein|nr:CBS domain-containing protein [Mycoplasmatota bacterium]
MNKETYFLELYNKLDTYLRVKHFNNNPSYMSYVRKLFYIKKHKLEPIINREHQFDVLKTAGEIRNIIAHNNDIIIPNESFLKTFENLVNRIVEPKKVTQVMTVFSDLQTKEYSDRLSEVIALMKDSGFASIPILNNKKFVGMFTERTVFDYLTISERIIDKDMLIKEFHEVIDLDEEPRKYFNFVDRKMTVDEAYDIFTSDFKDKHNLILLLVTENGSPKESLLGIVALRDLKNELL